MREALAAWAWGVLLVGVSAGWIPLSAQSKGRGAGGFHVGAYSGLVFDAAGSFSESVCESKTAFLGGGRLGYGILRFVSVEAAVSVHGENPDRCVDGLIPPPPDNGTRTLRFLDERVRGYPYVTTEGRLEVHTPEEAGRASVRLIGGGGWIWSKDIGVWLAGLGVGFGGARIRGTVDAERWWFDVPFTDVEEAYVNGTLVSSTESRGAFPENPIVLRLGVKWRP